ncbi:MAG: family 10 glycosylhydrolase [Phycisphaerae bacterium]|nr:family 10 glycosylhydrolase [Phycisphaerae bacterium]
MISTSRFLSRLVVCSMVWFLGACPVWAAEVIVDNTNSGFKVVSGSWSTGTASGMYGSNYRYAKTSTRGTSLVQWQPVIPTAGDYQVFVWYPAASNRPTDARFTVYYNGGSQAVAVNQTINGGRWVQLGTFNFAAGSSTNGRVTLTNLTSISNKRVAADAVRFYKPELPSLTMAVSPAGAGTTSPPAGGPYTKNLNEVVAISAAPEAGYVFSHWTVSAGSAVADPNAASTTVTMDQSKTVTAEFAEIPAVPPQLRAFWADVFHYGLQNASQIDQMISLAVQGNYNAIFAEVLAYHDNPVGSHGAYWRSNIVARSSYVTSSFDPLAYMIQKAHANGIELHCWLVAFRVSTAWPPVGNSFLTSHPEYFMVPRASIGAGPVKVGSDYVLDPGSPDAQEYLVSIVRELVTNYEIDGINWDYIRYTQTDAGYPADSSYANSGLKRFQRITGRTDVPAATGDTQWNDFRRRTIDELVRRVRAEIPSIANPRQPLRYTADLVTWGDAPSSFTSSSAYTLFSNWEYWLRMGWLDGGVPMCYDREYNSSQALYYRHWVDKCMIWRYDRHMYVGQAAYLNTMAGSVTQMAYAYNKGAEGTSNYSYYVTVDANMDGTGEHDTAWYPYVEANLFNEPAPTPSMPWRSPATAAEGTLWGRVTMGGAPVDDAVVQVGTLTAVRTDANGYYVVTLIPATASGTNYEVNAASGDSSATLTGVQVVAGDVRLADIVLGQ